MPLIKLKFMHPNAVPDFEDALNNEIESDDFSTDEDDEEYLRSIFSAHSVSSQVFHPRESSEESQKKVIIKKMHVTKDFAEQSAKNAEKLVLEEEQERRRLERRKERKRRKRERKKAAKGISKGDCDSLEERENVDEVDNEQNHNTHKSKHDKDKKDKSSSGEGSSEIDDDNDGFLDFNSAFVTKVVKHKLRINVNNPALSEGNSSRHSEKDISSTSPKQTSNGKQCVSITEHNLQLGERLAAFGYQCASKERYKEAIELFTRALRKVPTDHRYWGNRSFCYFQIGEFQKALEDADWVIHLASHSPKGHYRRAEALAGLKNLIAAEESFQRVLELDPDCEDAQKELLNIRMLRITEMGFNRKHALRALLKHNTMEAAVEALMTSPEEYDTESEEDNEVYNSDEEVNWDEIDTPNLDHDNSVSTVQSEISYTEGNVAIDGTKALRKQAAMDPSNPNHCVSIWVGNIEESVSEKILNDEFSRFGQISSIRMLPSSHCAFINFTDSKAPGPAMAAMQGKELAGKNLLIRYPNKTKEEQQLHQQMVCHQKRLQNAIGNVEYSGAEGAVGFSAPPLIQHMSTSNTKTTLVPTAKGTRVKLKGPVNGDECYYWRTTGCAFGDNCRNKHIKENQGIDRKPWHK